jgi:Zn ribbon nucleic-acid-binding protein
MRHYSIWVSLDKDDDFIHGNEVYDENNTMSYDINVWDEDRDDRAENLECGHIRHFYEAAEYMNQIIRDNKGKIHFDVRPFRDKTK